ncbi:MAG: sulfatase-like hydrolase/transferase [Candidatus Omnitrophica bacterium]|nr:sulfatase-like hydrolase/transferase [Candidatus Omnitrophota bacterium]
MRTILETEEGISAKQALFFILKATFLLLSLSLLNKAFYKWDGVAFYMPLPVYLLDLSLTFIIWTIMTLLITFFACLIIYGIFTITPKSLNLIRLETLTIWLVFILSLIIAEDMSHNYILTDDSTGLSHLMFFLICGVVAALAAWLIRRHVNQILNKINSYITPLVWIFGFLLIIAIPPAAYSIAKVDVSAQRHRAISSKVPSPGKLPNIILVTWDAATALDMELYGYHRKTTPFLKEWAKDGIVFKRTYSGCNWTSPSVMNLMTGQRSWTHKVWFRASNYSARTYEHNLPATLRNYGYNIYGFVQNKHADPDVLGIGEDFSINDHFFTFISMYDPGSPFMTKLYIFFFNRPIVREFIKEYPHFDDGIKKIVKMALMIKHSDSSKTDELPVTLFPPSLVYDRFSNNFDEGRIKSPFFAWLHTNPPHDPYLPPKPYMGLFGENEKTADILKRWKTINRSYKPEQQEEIDILRKRYDEFILYSDKQFEQFINNLLKKIDMSNTILIFSSDHGESFSNNVVGHGYDKFINEPVSRIPLIIKIPGVKGGLEVDDPVSQIDIAPTVLDLAGLPIPEWIEGQSLLPVINGKPLEHRPVFVMYLIKNPSSTKSISRGSIAVIDGDYKYFKILEDEKAMLFNLKNDPNETNNIIGNEHVIAQRLQQMLNDNLEKANARISQSSAE